MHHAHAAPPLAVGLADKAAQGLARLIAAQTVQVNLALQSPIALAQLADHIAAHAFAIGFRQVNVYPFPNRLFRAQRGNRFSQLKRPQSPLKTWWDRVRGSFTAGRRTARLHRHMHDDGGLVQLVK